MSLLRLENIGKIYVSENNVAVGIRGVNLSFDLGEFVAITGASGSGKSTLLNVISGMDTYEEGEFYVEEQPTSHYLQPDWEEYRQKYISFIFQDYNIIDSFTVLQNVELALMSIADPAARRKRAIELIDRVGLRSHMKHKGSHLSGGQKQRTVIARALAKESPIILADEPTGNLDSETSKEIIQLLRDVSKDKLLIVVTHNFDQVEEVATRHIRVYDGAIESDRTLAEPAPVEKKEAEPAPTPAKERLRTISNGFLLGKSIFLAKPRLSLYLCLLMIIGASAIFFVTAFCGDFLNVFKKNRYFCYEEGRVTFVRYTDEPITNEELEELAKELGAVRAEHYDYLYDVRIKTLKGNWNYLDLAKDVMTAEEEDLGVFTCTFGHDYGTPDFGRYPENEAEVLLYLPYFYKQILSEETIEGMILEVGVANYTISGVKFYPDSSQIGKAVMTEAGFRRGTAAYALDIGYIAYIQESDSLSFEIDAFGHMNMKFMVGDHMPEGSIYIDDAYTRNSLFQTSEIIGGELKFNLRAFMDLKGTNKNANQHFDFKGDTSIIPVKVENSLEEYDGIKTVEFRPSEVRVYVSPDLAELMLSEVGPANYYQASLFFKNDKEAAEAAKKLNGKKYLALTAKDTYKPNAGNLIERMSAAAVQFALWIIAILFLAFFINLCSHRAIGAFRDDMTIMRSMGIPTKVVRIGIYVRMFLALIPAFFVIPVLSHFVYRVPKLNMRLWYLQPWHYVILYIGLVLITLRVTRLQSRVLFGVSVKKSLRGGAEV